MKKISPIGSSFDSFLEQDGILEEIEVQLVKRNKEGVLKEIAKKELGVSHWETRVVPASSAKALASSIKKFNFTELRRNPMFAIPASVLVVIVGIALLIAEFYLAARFAVWFDDKDLSYLSIPWFFLAGFIGNLYLFVCGFISTVFFAVLYAVTEHVYKFITK